MTLFEARLAVCPLDVVMDAVQLITLANFAVSELVLSAFGICQTGAPCIPSGAIVACVPYLFGSG